MAEIELGTLFITERRDPDGSTERELCVFGTVDRVVGIVRQKVTNTGEILFLGTMTPYFSLKTPAIGESKTGRGVIIRTRGATNEEIMEILNQFNGERHSSLPRCSDLETLRTDVSRNSRILEEGLALGDILPEEKKRLLALMDRVIGR